MQIIKWISLCGFAAAMTLTAGCTQSDSGDTIAQNDSAEPQQTEADSPMADQSEMQENTDQTVTAQKVVDQAQETAQAAGELAQKTKDEFVNDLNNQLAEFDQKMGQMQQRAGSLSDEAKAEWQESWDQLQQQRQQMAQQMEKLQSATGDAWSEVREGTTAAWNDLQQAFEKANQHFEEDDTTDGAAATPQPENDTP